MLHHVSVGVSDVERATRFYDPVLKTLGYKRVLEYLPYGIGYGRALPEFWIQLPNDQLAPSVGNGTHIAFSAKTKKAAAAFHAAALSHGGTDNGAPGARPDYGHGYFDAFVLDPDGNRLEAVLISPVPKKKTKPARKPKKKPSKKTALKKTTKKKAPKKTVRKASKVKRKTPKKKIRRKGARKK